MRRGNLACTGKPFTEHRHIPDSGPTQPIRDPSGSRPLTSCGQRFSPPNSLPVTLSLRFPNCTSLKPGTVRHAFLALAEEGLVHIRHGRTRTIAGEPAAAEPGAHLQVTRPSAGHDCQLLGCRPHVCKTMDKSTIHGIHSILSEAFEAAMRWEWTDRNPARRRRCGRGRSRARHQGRTALHHQPAPGRRVRPAEHCRPPWPPRRRRDHAAPLRRPGPRGRPPCRRYLAHLNRSGGQASFDLCQDLTGAFAAGRIRDGDTDTNMQVPWRLSDTRKGKKLVCNLICILPSLQLKLLQPSQSSPRDGVASESQYRPGR
jgi:hypothetical protein